MSQILVCDCCHQQEWSTAGKPEELVDGGFKLALAAGADQPFSSAIVTVAYVMREGREDICWRCQRGIVRQALLAARDVVKIKQVRRRKNAEGEVNKAAMETEALADGLDLVGADPVGELLQSLDTEDVAVGYDGENQEDTSSPLWNLMDRLEGKTNE